MTRLRILLDALWVGLARALNVYAPPPDEAEPAPNVVEE